MKKSIFLIITLLAVSLLLAACVPAMTNPTGQTTTSPAPTTTDPVPTTTVPVPTTTVPDSTTISPTTNGEDVEIAEFQSLLSRKNGTRNSYYFALGHEFSNPKELKLRYFFDAGLEGRHTPTDAEKAVMIQYVGEEWVNNVDWYRLTKDKMEAELQKYFGLSLMDMPEAAYEDLIYMDITDCYYFPATGARGDADNVTVKSVNNNDDGTVSVTYTVGFGPIFTTKVVTLKPNGDGYLVLSNLKTE